MGTLALTAHAERIFLELLEHGSLLLPDVHDFGDDRDRLIWVREGGTVIVEIEPPQDAGADPDPERSADLLPFPTLDSPPRRDVA